MTYFYEKQDKSCPVCKGQVYGRRDKVYCSARCKNRHHYNTRQQNEPLTVAKNKRLMRNLTILQGMLGVKARFGKIALEELVRRGFDPASNTGAGLVHHKGRATILYECYHFSYYIGTDGVVVIEQAVQKIDVRPFTFERWEKEFPKEMRVNGLLGFSDRCDYNRRE